MDTTQSIVVGTAAVLLLSYIGSQLLVRYPGTRAWVQNVAVKGYNYLDSVKDDVPPEAKAIWDAAYRGCDAIVDAFADDKLTAKELKRIGYEGLRLVNEVRKLIG